MEKQIRRHVTVVEDSFAPLMGNVQCGEFFIYEGNLCVRTSKNTSGQWEAFEWETNEKIWIPHTDRVHLVECTITYRYMQEPDD